MNTVAPTRIADDLRSRSRRLTLKLWDRDVAVVFGRYFNSNPDLVFRIQNGLSLDWHDRKTFYECEERAGVFGLCVQCRKFGGAGLRFGTAGMCWRLEAPRCSY